MDAKHLGKPDPRPKRRKDRDNPYTIFTIGKDTDNPHYYLSFIDGQGIPICIEISEPVFRELDRQELEDLSHLNKAEKYLDNGELTDDILSTQVSVHQDLPEELIECQLFNEALHRCIHTLPEIQRRRVVLYFFGGYTYEQIAKQEGCSKTAVILSVNAGLAAIKKELNKL